MSERPVILAGIPARAPYLYKRILFNVHDTVVLIDLPGEGTHLILRDIEIDRAREAGAADHYYAPSDLAPKMGLSGDRDTSNAQAAAELLRRRRISEVWTDRALPMLFAHYLTVAGVAVHCDPEMGILERRAKSDPEIEMLRAAQMDTEEVMRLACEMIATAEVDGNGVLQRDGAPLTSERVRAAIEVELIRRGYASNSPIVAGGAQGADPHNKGAGPLSSGQPVIIDIFPQNQSTLYCGDCTRCVVHGEIPDAVGAMHAAVVKAKEASIDACRAGVTGEQVHRAAIDSLKADGFESGRVDGAPESRTAMLHGTGHGIGIEVHEPPLLDTGGPELIFGDALTVEPGLYCKAIGGIRVEDLVIIREGGVENLNTLPEGLTWA